MPSFLKGNTQELRFRCQICLYNKVSMTNVLLKGGNIMSNTAKTNQNIVYLNHKTSGLSATRTESTILPHAMSNITKGQVLIVPHSTKLNKPVSTTK